MQNLLAELIGTMLLIVLGDGVVANVVLTGTKGENVRLDRDHHGMGRRGGDGRLCGRADQRRASEPGA